MFRVEFSELKNSLERTVERNPILHKEQEHFIFSRMTECKNRAFRLMLESKLSFEVFVDLVRACYEKGNAHEVFMIKPFTNSDEYDANIEHALSCVHKIVSGEFTNALSDIQSLNVSYDIFEDVKNSFINECSDNVVVNTFLSNMEYYVEKIYLANIKIVLRILSIYRNTELLTVKDLFSEGTLGLRRAIELYNCDIGIKFSTYASQWIKASINRAIADKDSLIRIPVNVREQIKEVDKIRKSLKLELKRDPIDEEIIAKMKKKVSALSQVDLSFAYYQIDTNPREQGLDSQGNSKVDVSFEENLVDSNIIDETDAVTIKDFKAILSEYVNSIKNHQEKYYIEQHFGLNSDNTVKSKEEIISVLQINQNEYDRIRKRALSNIKKTLSRNKVVMDAYSIETGWDANSNVEI